MTGRGLTVISSAAACAAPGRSSRCNRPSSPREIGEPRRHVAGHGQIPQRRGRIAAGHAERCGEPGHLVGQRRGVERDRVRQDHRVGVGVHEVEPAAQHVAQLVVQTGRRRAERDAGEVRAVEQRAAGIDVVGRCHHRRQRVVDRAHAFERQRRRDRVVARRVQRLDGVSQRVERRRTGDLRRQADGQLGVVDDGLRLHDRVLAGLLVAPAGEPVDRRLLAAGVRGRHGDDRHVVAQRHRLGQTRRRAAADAHDASIERVGRGRAGPFGELDGHVLGDLVPRQRQS